MPSPSAPSGVVKNSLIVGGRRTTIRLDPEFWDALEEIARIEGISIHTAASRARIPGRALTATVRVFVLQWYRARCGTLMLSPPFNSPPDI